MNEPERSSFVSFLITGLARVGPGAGGGGPAAVPRRSCVADESRAQEDACVVWQ